MCQTCQHETTQMYKLCEDGNESWWFKRCINCGYLLNNENNLCTTLDIEEMLRVTDILPEHRQKVIEAFHNYL
jgi:hypothetical protein